MLPVCLLAAAAVMLLHLPSAFVCGSFHRSNVSALRAGTTGSALPTGVEGVAATSLSTALQVSTWGWYANVVCIAVPIIFLITLYLNSEKTKLRDGVEPGSYI